MNPKEHADPGCPGCHGRGKLKTGQGIAEVAICSCVVAALDRTAARAQLDRLLQPRARQMTLASYKTGGNEQNQRALEVAENFVDHFNRARQAGWMICFYGQPRCGKTHLAVAIAQACVERHSGNGPLTTQLLNIPAALAVERQRMSDGGQSPFARASKVDLLVVDDLGAEYERQPDGDRVSWISERMYELLDDRVMDELPTIFTTNLTPSDLERRYKNEAWQRVYHRLISGLVIPPLEIFRIEGHGGYDREAKALLHKVRA